MSRGPILAAAPLLLLSACATALDGAAPVLQDVEPYLDREVMLSVADLGDEVAILAVEAEHGLQQLDHNVDISVGRYALPEQLSVRAAVERLENDHRVNFAEPNYIARAAAVNDPYLGYQWNLSQLGVDQAWDHGTGAGITVAVLDTGVKRSGPDGIGDILSGYDFYSGDGDPTDRQGHGTFVAGTIAQKTDNGTGVAGVAPDASILPVKVMSDQGYGDMNAIVNGITWSTNQGAHVINMSLGSYYSSQSLQQACQYAHDNGVVIVAASGNEYASSVSYPAAYDTVIAVGASRYDGSRAAYSNTGSGLDLLAPGGDLSKDQNGDGYADGILQETIENGSWTYTFWEGTSMAAPHVAAAAALVMAQGVNDPDQVAEILTSTATDVGSYGYDTQSGYGRLDLSAAVALAAGSSTDDSGDDGWDDGWDEGGDDTSDDTIDDTTDTSPPEFSDVGATTDGGSFTIYWTTNEPADSYVDFEGYGSYGDDALLNAHSLSFTGQEGATYTVTLESTDAAGNKGTDGPYQLNL